MNIVIGLVIIVVIYFLSQLLAKLDNEYGIRAINQKGFTLMTMHKHKRKVHKTSEKEIYWNNISEVSFNKNKTGLIFKDSDGKTFKLDNKTANWYLLIQSIPAHFTSFDHAYVADFMKKNEKVDLLEITLVNEQKVEYTVSHYGKESTRSFRWDNIRDAAFSDGKTILVFTKNDDSETIISNDIDNWYWLLKHVPAGFTSFDYTYVQALFESLKPCHICGNISVLGNECLACYESTWEASSGYPDKEQFIREMQLEVFSPVNPDEELSFELPDSKAFVKNPDWFPSITKIEMLAFSKENYWE